MKQLMCQQFVLDYYQEGMLMKLYSLSQDELCVSDYMHEFETLMIHCDINKPREHTIARFITG